MSLAYSNKLLVKDISKNEFQNSLSLNDSATCT